MLCEIYLQMVSGTGKPSLWFLVRNLGLRGGDIIVVANPDLIFRQYERPVFSATALPRFRPETYCTTRSQRHFSLVKICPWAQCQPRRGCHLADAGVKKLDYQYEGSTTSLSTVDATCISEQVYALKGATR